jgi:hypothetical protein
MNDSFAVKSPLCPKFLPTDGYHHEKSPFRSNTKARLAQALPFFNADRGIGIPH